MVITKDLEWYLGVITKVWSGICGYNQSPGVVFVVFLVITKALESYLCWLPCLTNVTFQARLVVRLGGTTVVVCTAVSQPLVSHTHHPVG